MVSATAQMKQMQALTKAITEQTEQMQKVFSNLTNTLQGIEKAKKPLTEAEQKIENVRAALERAEGAATGFDKRTQILNNAIKQSFIDGEKGFALGIKSFRQYRKAGGNAFEYVAEFLGTSNEELRIFGVEAAKVRSVMFGFLPPGTFRLVNKVKSSFQLFGSVLRTVQQDAKDGEEQVASLAGTLVKASRGLSKIATLNRDTIFGEKRAGRLKASRERRKEIKKEINALQNRAKIAKKLGLTSQAAEAESKIGSLRKEFEGRKGYERTIRRAPAAEFAKKQQKKIGNFLTNLKKIGFTGIIKLLGKMALTVLFAVGKVLVGFLIYSFFILGALFVIIKGLGPSIFKALQDTWEVIKQISGPILAGLFILKTGFEQIFRSIFGDGDLETLIDGILNIAIGLVVTALSVLGVLLVAVLKFTQVLISDLLKRTIDFFRGSASTAKKIAVIAGILAAIVAFIVGAPVLIAAAIGAAIFYVFRKIFPGKGNARAPLLQTTGIPAFAEGGVVNSPVALVGEKGPELVSLPNGSRVHSNADSQKMMGNTINITVNAKDTSRAEMNRIANEIANIVSGKISRTTNSRTFR